MSTSVLDRAISPRAALWTVAVVVTLATYATQGQGVAAWFRALYRMAVLTIIVIGAASVGLARLQEWRANRPPRPARAAGVRRLDLYIVGTAIVLALLFFAQANRYTISHYRVDDTLIYQRTDRWTGVVEIWASSTGIPRPTWMQTASQ